MSDTTPIPLGIGFESASYPHVPNAAGKIIPVDNFDTSRHARDYKSDWRIMRSLGVTYARIPIRWPICEPEEGVWDFDWTDKYVSYVRSLGVVPIFDLLHHNSPPTYLPGGVSDQRFTECFVRYAIKVVERYNPRYITPINEMFPTAWFCFDRGIWYPHKQGEANLVEFGIKMAEAYCRAVHAMRDVRPDIQIVHNDSCESHSGLDPRSVVFARRMEGRKHFLTDLILGRVDHTHPYYSTMRKHGFDDEQEEWFRKNRIRIDILGLDIYVDHQHQYIRPFGADSDIFPSRAPIQWHKLIRSYWEYFGHIPIMILETNFRGTITTRMLHFKIVAMEAEMARSDGVDLRALYWFGGRDTCDWGKTDKNPGYVTRPMGDIDPVGVLWCDQRNYTAHQSEFSEVFGAYGRGEITAYHIPAYRPEPPTDRIFDTYSGFMQGPAWKWKDQVIPKSQRR
jgi:hypothetical protein